MEHQKHYGFFPGNEHKRDASFSSGPQSADPVWTVTRRQGIPTLAVIGVNGDLLRCFQTYGTPLTLIFTC
eukprot:COSAG03_NODE_1053_length_4945_cov_10.648783_6_plen_70_part_00